MEITKDKIINAYKESNGSKLKFRQLLHISNYYVSKYEKLFDIKLEWKRPFSPYSMDYWTERGYSIEDAKYNIAIRRSYNLLYWTHKYGEIDGKRRYIEFITKGTVGKSASFESKCRNMRCMEYWTNNMGYDTDTAKQKLSEIQSTFSLQSCIDKYGEIDGQRIFDERQIKWQTTLNNKSIESIEVINKKKVSNSISYLIENYGDEWLSYYISRNFIKNTNLKQIVLNAITYSTLNDIIENITVISPKYIHLYRLLHNNLIQYKYEINGDNIDDIHAKMMIKYGVSDYKKTKYGCKIHYNNVTYGSKGEFQIAKFLTEANIEFLYNKVYSTNNKFRYDFYIIDKNVYIEFTGLTGKKNYDYRIEEKRMYCLNNSLNVYFSNNVNDVMNYIKTIYK